MRFCQALMTELYRHLGPDTDVLPVISAWADVKWALWPG
jgi:glutamate dehydrogenase/leucine dehydrogenase